MQANLSNALRAVASRLQAPVMLILIILMAAAVFLIGWLIVEAFTERLRLKAKLPALAEGIREGALPDVIESSGLLRRQKAALIEVTRHPDMTPAMRESLAVRLIEKERSYYDGITKISDIIARLGPMFGLLGTLIPLGPGIIALGRGDTFTLSQSFLAAFDTTIAGLISAAVAFVISIVRKRWYSGYMASLEMAMECLLERLAGEAKP